MRSEPHPLLRWMVALLAVAAAAGMGFEAAQIRSRPYLGLSERGREIALVAPGGPAARAGLRAGDRIVAVDGRSADELPDPGAYLRGLGLRPIPLVVERGEARETRVIHPEPLPGTEVTWRLLHFGTALLTLLVGTLVFTRRAGLLTSVFFGLCLTLAVLLFRPFGAGTHWSLVAGSLLVEFLSMLLPGLLLHFFLLFPYERATLSRHPWLLALVYGPGALLFTMSVLPAAALGSQAEWVHPVVDLGSMLYVASMILIAVVLFIRTYRRSELPSVRRKLKVTLWGTVLGLCPIMVVLVIHGLFPDFRVPGDRLASLMIFFLPASFGYAIVRHGVFEIEFIVKRSLVYSALTSVFILFYFLLFFSMRHWLRDVPLLGEQVGSLLFVVLVLLVMSPLRGRLQDRLDRWFYPDRYDTQRGLRELSIRIREARTVDALSTALLKACHDVLAVEVSCFFRPDPNGDCYLPVSGFGLEPDAMRPLKLGRLLAEPLFREREPLFRSDLEAELPYGYLPRPDLMTLEACGAQVLIPLASGTRRLGILVLGPRTFREPYSRPDLMLLEGLEAQATLALENVLFLEESRGHAEHQREMQGARAIQEQLLPRSLPRLAQFDLAARMIPCHEVGGDYYDCVEGRGRSEGSVTFVIGDVSGKGVPAALLMANVQATFRAEAQSGRNPEDLLGVLNRRLCAIERPERFVSLFLAELDVSKRRLRYSNAGHPPPMLYRATGAVERLERGGLLLGIREGERYESDEIALMPGDFLLMFTDGVVERGGPMTRFDESGLEVFAGRHRHLGAEDLLQRVLAETLRVSTAEHDDDTTLLIVKAL